MIFRSLENAFSSLKNESKYFYSCPSPKTKLSPKFKFLSLPPRQILKMFFPSKNGGGYYEEILLNFQLSCCFNFMQNIQDSRLPSTKFFLQKMIASISSLLLNSTQKNRNVPFDFSWNSITYLWHTSDPF